MERHYTPALNGDASSENNPPLGLKASDIGFRPAGCGRRRAVLLLLATIAFVLSPEVARSATFIVNNTADAPDASPGNGVCATAGGQCTLRSAIQEADALGGADTITVPAGTFTSTDAADGDYEISDDLTINGAGRTATVIDGGALDRVFDITGGNVTITGLTIQNGATSFSGAGILAQSPLTLINVIVTGNTTSGNAAGVRLDHPTASLTITDSVVSGNSATGGNCGGICFKNSSGTLTLTNVTVSGNTASGDGGGIRVDGTGSTATFSGVTVNGNSAEHGAGIHLQTLGSATLTNLTLSGNTSGKQGGGFRQSDGTATYTGLTITGNSAVTGGGGLVVNGSATAQLRNSIVAGNPSGNDCFGSVIDLGGNLDGDGSCGFGATAAPMLGPLQNNGGPTFTHALLAGSPAIEGGINGGCPGTDQRGVARPQDGDLDLTAVCDAGAYEYQPPTADLTLTKSANPDPAPEFGPLVYTLLIANGGPDTATSVTLTDNLPPSVTLVSATPSQGACAGVAVVTCNLGAILNGGTASVEILVTTGAPATITNDASVTASEVDPVPADNLASIDTDVVASGGGFDVPLTQFRRLHGFIDSTVTGGSLRTQPNTIDPCAVTGTDAGSLAGIPGSATVTHAYLYWAGSGSTVDGNVTLDAVPLVADRTFQSQLVLGSNTYDFFGGVKDVTAQVDAKRNGAYTFSALTVDAGAPYCSARAVMAGWSLLVIYEDAALTGKTLVLYDGFDLERNGSTSYLLSGIYATAPVEATETVLLWEGDENLGTGAEELLFNGTQLSDAFNPADNVYNSTINTLGASTEYGVDLDTFDVSGLVAVGDTLATTDVSVGPDLVILNAVMLQVRTNIIVGTVFEDVNYGGGTGRDLATAVADAPSFAVRRPGATIELYDTGGTLLRTTVTDANGQYGFTGLPDADYTVRVVNETVTSSRPGSSGAEMPVQTFRTDASAPAVTPVTSEVGGADPGAQDDPANGGGANLSALVAQSLAPVTITAATAKTSVDFGFNFDSVVNTNSAGQGSLSQFVANANILTNANLDQDGLTVGVETSVFMIPSNADPLGRPTDANFDAGRGVAVLALTAGLPPLTDTDTAIDGTTQTALVGDTNAVLLGAGGTVGVGADGVAGTADEAALPQVPGPEIEIVDAAGLPIGIDIQASDTIVRGLAVYGFGSNPASPSESNIRIDNGTGLTGMLVEQNVIGSAADVFADPGAGVRTGGQNIFSLGADNSTLRDNLIGFAEGSGFNARSGSAGWLIQGNEFRSNSTFGYPVGDGVAFEGAGSGTATIDGNLIINNGATGIETFGADGAVTVTENTVSGNGFGTGVGAGETPGVRLYGAGNRVERTVIEGNFGAGILVASGSVANTFSRNSIFGNGTVNGQIGIDLLAPGDDADLGTAPFVSTNDTGDADAGGNDRHNFPVIESAAIAAGNLTLTGWARPGDSLEWFIANADGSGFGEGETWLTTLVEGSGADTDPAVTAYAGVINGLTQGSDTTNRYSFTIPTPPGVGSGTILTATGTDGGGNTSEFGGVVQVDGPLTLYKRAFLIDGTPIGNGATIPTGIRFVYVLYVSNAGSARADVSIQDVLDPAFVYQPGTLQIDNSVAACATLPCTPAEEAAIFAAVTATPFLTDAADADGASYAGGSTTIDAGNQNAANAQTDVAANTVLAVAFSVTMP